MEQLLNALGGKNGAPLQQLASQFGISGDQVESAVGKLAPALTGALGKNTAKPDGMSSLAKALGSGNHARYVDEPSSLADPATRDDGNAILGHLLGSKDESRRVAGDAAKETGLDAGMLKQMLPLVATMVMGSLGKSGGGGGGAGLAAALQGLGIPGAAGSSSGGSGLGGILGKILKR